MLATTGAALTATTDKNGNLINPSLTDDEYAKAMNTALAAWALANNVTNADLLALIASPELSTLKPKVGAGTTDAAVATLNDGAVANGAANPGTVWHATRTPGAASGILDNGIDPAFLNPNSRFG